MEGGWNFDDYIDEELRKRLLEETPATDIDGLKLRNGSKCFEIGSHQFMLDVYNNVKADLESLLLQRKKDRTFVDQRTRACSQLNRETGRSVVQDSYYSVIGQRDADGRVVVGPMHDEYTKPCGKSVAPLPSFMQGPHVTVFGVATDPQACDAAMNACSSRLASEPAIISELLDGNPGLVSRWGVDFEDSMTPTQENFAESNRNLDQCFELQLNGNRLSMPFKRVAGLALPATFCFYKGNPLPLHVYDLALHIYKHWNNPLALVFYIPKLENEEEARYFRKLIAVCEEMIHSLHPSYNVGTVRVIIVIENARAIFRVNEIMDELFPYFAGASLGWHDYLASTARLFKEDADFRIPVKADSTIVINHIKASHKLLADVVSNRGGIAIGGMYGILPVDGNMSSFDVSIRGYVRDVVTQLKRGLQGFWVARPDFVRMGLAITEAWRMFQTNNDRATLERLIADLVAPEFLSETLEFVFTPENNQAENMVLESRFPRSLIVADVPESLIISNRDAKEVRYNVFQSLQYLAAWIGGNGCVSLPGEVLKQPVLILDDLATVERSRWEIWHEIHHGRFCQMEFVKIVHEELNGIRREMRPAFVEWSQASEWYPLAADVLLCLCTSKRPPEFVTEVILSFTVGHHALEIDPFVHRFNYFFERCGSQRFAFAMAETTAIDLSLAKRLILNFSIADIKDAASFHGDIGQNKASLDKIANSEQDKIGDDEKTNSELRRLGGIYIQRHGFKYLVSAKGKTGTELLQTLKSRIDNPIEIEVQNARLALWEITRKRLETVPTDGLLGKLEELREKHGIKGASICIKRSLGKGCQSINLGWRVDKKEPVTSDTLFEIASLSKTIGTTFALEYFKSRGIALDTPANVLLEDCGSPFRLTHPEWGNSVLLEHLMSHCALNMHYVYGVPLGNEMPDIRDLLNGHEKYGYSKVEVVGEPGTCFKYSGGGFLVVQHIIECFEKQPVDLLLPPFFKATGAAITFNQTGNGAPVAHGYDDTGTEIQGTRKMFPAFAAGGLGTSRGMMTFLDCLADAYNNPKGSGPISHDTAVRMLHGTDKGCVDFMGVQMGIGVFVGEAGPNRFAIHQGANDGFRAIFMHCFHGPDKGAGVVVFANGDNGAMRFIAEVSQHILREMCIQGVDTSRFPKGDVLSIDKIPQEEIVNYGYKHLVFSAFTPTLPVEITDKGPLDPLSRYNAFCGATLVRATNQRFARASNLASEFLPKFDPELFCAMGKVMDSWETARHNPQLFDYAVFQLVPPGGKDIEFVSLSTKYHDGNQAEFVEILYSTSHDPDTWLPLVAKTHISGHAEKNIKLGHVVRHIANVMVRIYPDGGLTRIGLFNTDLPQHIQKKFVSISQATSIRSTDPIPTSVKPLQLLYEPSSLEISSNIKALRAGQIFDAASLAYGGKLISVTDQHYGPAAQVLSPFIPLSMHDGFESARSRQPGHREVLHIGLGIPCKLQRIVLDFTYFVNNNPLRISVLGKKKTQWEELTQGEVFVKPYAGNTMTINLTPAHEAMSELKFFIFPDGGINRIHAYGAFEPLSNI